MTPRRRPGKPVHSRVHLDITRPNQASRRNTSHVKATHLAQLPLGADLGRRSWVHRNLSLRIAESRQDRALVSEIVMRRHYLKRRATPPRVLVLSYLASLRGEGAAAMAMVTLLHTNLGALLPALGLHQAEFLTLARSWRADDLGPDTAPDMMPEVLRRIVKRVAAEWAALKCSHLSARPGLLVTWSDPSPGVQHDGGLYFGAGAIPLGGKSKLLFAWPLDESLRQPLRAYAARARA